MDNSIWEARYNNDVERGKRTTRDVTSIIGASELFDQMRGSAAAWSSVLGYPVRDDPTMHGGGIHVTEPGGWLSTHLDYARHPKLPRERRALNLIAFVHREWRKEWGGELELCDPMGTPVLRIAPQPGRLVAFEVSDLSYHGVAPTSPDAAERVSLAVYYLAEATPADTRMRAMFLPNRTKEN
jgi:Rps23 Pro-64 3,4-dihydroxylase Tpa1-like proline 4-hydroxylase